MKVLHVVRGLLNSSGTTHIVGPLAEAQAKLGAEVALFFVAKDSAEPVLPDNGLVTSRCFALSVPLSNPGISLQFARYVNRAVSTFDVVHVHAVWNFPTWWAMRTAARDGIPYVVAPQGSFESWALGQSGLQKRLYGSMTEIPLLNRASRLQALTANEAAQFAQFGLTAPAVVIPNGVDVAKFGSAAPPLWRQLGFEEPKRTILYLSRIHRKKGLDILIKAFAKVSPHHMDAVLVVAGNDAGSGHGDRMKKLAHECGIAGRVHFVGEVSGPRKLDMLSGADAFALTSYSEGLPVVVLEAMASRLPIVASTACNLPEIAARSAGYVIVPDSLQVAAALDRLLSDPAMAVRMGHAGRKLVEQCYTWSHIARQTLDLYEELTEPARVEELVYG